MDVTTFRGCRENEGGVSRSGGAYVLGHASFPDWQLLHGHEDSRAEALNLKPSGPGGVHDQVPRGFAQRSEIVFLQFEKERYAPGRSTHHAMARLSTGSAGAPLNAILHGLV